MQILSKYRLSAAKDVPISNLRGWKPVTRVSFINALKVNQSLFITPYKAFFKPLEYADVMLSKIDQLLSKLIKDAKADGEYRTVKQASPKKIIFSNGSRLDFDQIAKYKFVLAKPFDGGTCYYMWDISEDRFEENSYGFTTLLYYVQD